MAGPLMTGRSMERLIAFSDGVVGVAVTVMIVPIFDTPGPQPGETMLNVLSDNLGNVIAYIFTFYVVVTMWLAHHRVFNELRAYDSRTMLLNTIWLMTIGFLPWPSYLIGEGDGIERGIGALYFGVLAISTLMLGLMADHIRRHPELLNPGETISNRGMIRSIAFFAAFVFIAVLSSIWGAAANVVVLAIPLLSFLLRPRTSDKPAKPSDSPPAPAD